MWETKHSGQGLGKNGQSLLETAFLLPVLLLILAGALDLGRVFNAYIVLTNAAREGARYGTLHPTDLTGIRYWAKIEAQSGGITLQDAAITITTTGAPGTPIQVDIDYELPVIMTGILGITTVPIQGSIQMPVL